MKMCEQKGLLRCSVNCSRLKWMRGEPSEELKLITDNLSDKFDVIVGADVLFFRDFHIDLIVTLSHALTPDGVSRCL